MSQGKSEFHIEVMTECGWERIGLDLFDLIEAAKHLEDTFAEGLQHIRLTDEAGNVRLCVDERGVYEVKRFDPVVNF